MRSNARPEPCRDRPYRRTRLRTHFRLRTTQRAVRQMASAGFRVRSRAPPAAPCAIPPSSPSGAMHRYSGFMHLCRLRGAQAPYQMPTTGRISPRCHTTRCLTRCPSPYAFKIQYQKFAKLPITSRCTAYRRTASCTPRPISEHTRTKHSLGLPRDLTAYATRVRARRRCTQATCTTYAPSLTRTQLAWPTLALHPRPTLDVISDLSLRLAWALLRGS